jgi:anti-sigma factor RsiW
MKPRDVELLSAYLDGQLAPSDSTRLEARLRSEPELVSVMDDLRTARGYLRQLPQRRAPRNFTLTRKMVGLNPPLPRAYPVFRFTTAIATLLFFLTYGFNFLAPQFASQPVYGMGGGGGVETYSAEAPAAAATEAPAAAEAPVEPQLSAPVITATAETAQDRMAETPAAKNGEEPTQDAYAFNQSQLAPPQAQPSPPPQVPAAWQYLLLGVAVLGAVFMIAMRQLSTRRWK